MSADITAYAIADAIRAALDDAGVQLSRKAEQALIAGVAEQLASRSYEITKRLTEFQRPAPEVDA